MPVMSTAGTAPERSDGRIETSSPDAQAPKRRRNPWIWICAVLAVIAAGLLVWALTIRSDLDSTQQDVSDLQSQLDESQDNGSALAASVKALFNDLAQQLGATTEDLAATQEQLDASDEAAANAEQDAAAAKQRADEAESAIDKAKAQADEAKARAEAAGAKAAAAGDCAKAYVSAFGALFEGDSVRAQAPAVREQLQGITADCKSALGG
jgi:uncharacterized membrane-anchored protein YhcB (DUF1043 family)